MSAHDLHHKITAFRQQVEILQSAAASPAHVQEVLLEMLEALQASQGELRVAEEKLHRAEEEQRQSHNDLVVAHRQAETGLRDREARTQAILQTAVDGIITIDMRGIIESLNPAAERLFGYSADEVIGHNVTLLMPSPYREEHDGYLARYLQTGEPHIIGIGREVRGQRRDGTTFPMALAVSEIDLDGLRLFTGIVHDLSARVQAEDALRQARDELEQRVRERTAALQEANDDIRRFAYIVSHDLRAPLVNLHGFAQELRNTC